MLQRIRITIPKTTMTYMAILAVAVVGAVMREINLLIILAGMMSGPLLISRVMIRSTLRDLKVKRRVPRGVFLGAPCRIEVEVRNPRRRIDSWALVAEDRLRNINQEGSDKQAARALIPHVAAGSSKTTHYDARFWSRGRYRLGPLKLTTKVPVGLLKGHRTFRDVDDVIVYPQLGELLDGWSSFARFENSGSQSSRRRQGPMDGDFYGLRDWRSGDSRRWIHWRSSAKRRELVVRQYEEQQNHNLMLLLDLAPAADPSQQPSGAQATNSESTPAVDDYRIERVISFVATLVARHCSQGAGQLTLCVAGDRQLQVRGAASAGIMNDALEVLAELQYAPGATAPNESLGGLPPIASEDQVIGVSVGPFAWDRWLNADDPRHGHVAAQALEIDLTTNILDGLFQFEAASPSGATPQQTRNGSSTANVPATELLRRGN